MRHVPPMQANLHRRPHALLVTPVGGLTTRHAGGTAARGARLLLHLGPLVGRQRGVHHHGVASDVIHRLQHVDQVDVCWVDYAMEDSHHADIILSQSTLNPRITKKKKNHKLIINQAILSQSPELMHTQDCASSFHYLLLKHEYQIYIINQLSVCNFTPAMSSLTFHSILVYFGTCV